MARPLVFHDDRLFPADARTRSIARELYGAVKALFKSDDVREGPLAFAQKRPPQWKGR